MSDMFKRLAKYLLLFGSAVLVESLARPATAMLFEPFFTALWDYLGVSSQGWVAPLISVLDFLSGSSWVQITAGVLAGIGAGILLHRYAVRFDTRRAEEKVGAIATVVPKEGWYTKQEEFNSLRSEVEKHARWRASDRRKKELESVRAQIIIIFERHKKKFDHYAKIIREGDWETDQMSDWPREKMSASSDLSDLSDLRGEILFLFKDLELPVPARANQEPVPFSLQNNPFLNTPDVDRLKDDAQKFEHRKTYHLAIEFIATEKQILGVLDAEIKKQSAIIQEASQ